jgi:pimeloyl-ACP methyl ester carboxylesterase
MNIRTFENDGLVFEYLEWTAAPEAEVVVLLHGFPQPATVWTEVAEKINAQGFCVVAPYLRGYSEGATPRRIRAYSLDRVAGDIRKLVQERHVDKVHLVGHDWGGAVAWVFAADSPKTVQSLTVASMPHPRALPRALVTTPQLFKSWYILLFQVPGLVELLLRLVGKRLAYVLLKRTGLSTEIANNYVDRLTQNSKTVRGALNWYRAFPFNVGPVLRMRPIHGSTVFIWSTEDVAVDGRAARLSSKYVAGSYRYVELDGITHWIPEQAPEKLATLVVDHAISLSGRS